MEQGAHAFIVVHGAVQHDLASTAILSDLLAQRLEVAYPEGAFAAGLLHDVGRLILALALPDH